MASRAALLLAALAAGPAAHAQGWVDPPSETGSTAQPRPAAPLAAAPPAAPAPAAPEPAPATRPRLDVAPRAEAPAQPPEPRAPAPSQQAARPAPPAAAPPPPAPPASAPSAQTAPAQPAPPHQARPRPAPEPERPQIARPAEPARPAPRPRRPAPYPETTGRIPDAVDVTAVREEAAQDLAIEYLASWSGPNGQSLDDITRFYAPRVRFHGRTMSARALLDEKRRFVRRWPERQYTPREETLGVACEPRGDTCTVRSVYDYTAENPEQGRRSQGIGTLELVVSFQGERPAIISETSILHGRGRGERSPAERYTGERAGDDRGADGETETDD